LGDKFEVVQVALDEGLALALQPLHLLPQQLLRLVEHAHHVQQDALLFFLRMLAEYGVSSCLVPLSRVVGQDVERLLLLGQLVLVERLQLGGLVDLEFPGLGHDQQVGDRALEQMKRLLDLVVAPHHHLSRRVSGNQVSQRLHEGQGAHWVLAAARQRSLPFGAGDVQLLRALLQPEGQLAASLLGQQFNHVDAALAVADEGAGLGEAERGRVVVVHLVQQRQFLGVGLQGELQEGDGLVGEDHQQVPALGHSHDLQH
jgi:hypothetical protein